MSESPAIPEPGNRSETVSPNTTGKRWVGSLLSAILTGSGLFLAGRTKEGIAWFIGELFVLAAGLAVLTHPTRLAILVTAGIYATWVLLWLVMVVRSFRPVKPTVSRFLFVMVAFACVSFLKEQLILFLYQPVRMPSASMAPTILGAPKQTPNKGGDHVLINRETFRFQDPQRGDIVSFRTAGLPGVPQDLVYLKRIIGLPGETLTIRDGKILVNGSPPAETVVREMIVKPLPPLAGNAAFAVDDSFTIPQGSYFMIGDNTANSFDSRMFGPVKKESITGKATHIYWPADRIGALR
jgi:signal peptidase I